jgi:hypothetical protein
MTHMNSLLFKFFEIRHVEPILAKAENPIEVLMFAVAPMNNKATGRVGFVFAVSISKGISGCANKKPQMRPLPEISIPILGYVLEVNGWDIG